MDVNITINGVTSRIEGVSEAQAADLAAAAKKKGGTVKASGAASSGSGRRSGRR